MASFVSKLLAGVAAAIGAAIVARKYTEPPPREQPTTQALVAVTEPSDGHEPRATTAVGEATHERGRLRAGWSRPKPDTIPQPTYWPAALALGIALVMWGIISNVFVLAVGLILFIIALTGWIGDLLHEF